MSTLSPPASPVIDDDDLDRVFAALANRTRRAMLATLGSGPSTVTDLAVPFAMSLPGASKHLRVLERAGLIHRHIDGRIHRCSLDPAPLEDAEKWLIRNRAFWNEQLDSLVKHLDESAGDEIS